MKIVQLTDETRADIQSRLLKRNPANYKEQQGAVDAILKEIRERGDEALFGYTEKFDHIRLTRDTIQVTEEEIKEAYDLADPDLIDVIRKALVNIRNFHEKQVHGDAGRNDSRTARHAPLPGRRVRSGRQGGLPVFGPDEYCTGEGRRCRRDYHDDPVRAGRKGESGRACRGE